MSRRILCQSCGDNWKPHPTDIHEGWQHKLVHLSVKKPDHHAVTVITEDNRRVISMDNILCDTCGKVIPDGTVCFALTMWRADQCEGIEPWEHEYGTVLPAEAAKLAKVMGKEGP